MAQQLNTPGTASLSSLKAELKARGFGQEFIVRNDGRAKLQEHTRKYTPEELRIIETLQIPTGSRCADPAVVYLIEDEAGNTGYLMNAFGAYADYEGDTFYNFIRKMSVHKSYENTTFGVRD
ncbi:hypothetical protein MKQ68_14770 [Chitinophaga horti]|uniref:Phosphoribosylpyrophosphate synthetase n=1 Tax=Chitinophaga horti TaxID=2920382 RepID=A0ABY6IVH0_9BACT|nr:hypothetical protein [Chitinophaga horti]UYQ91354.1 hypothetical protein MKQ68_14770 [Chitinophaga horti]